jgi:hypothetical protein
LEKHRLRNVKCEASMRLYSRHRSEIKTLKGVGGLQASKLAHFELTAYAATNACLDSERKLRLAETLDLLLVALVWSTIWCANRPKSL